MKNKIINQENEISELEIPRTLKDIKANLLTQIVKKFYCLEKNVLSDKSIETLEKGILTCKYLDTNNLNRDFISTKGFSIVFKSKFIDKVKKEFPFFEDYIDLALDDGCNAFYLNPLIMSNNSRVDGHIDRSLRAYLKTIDPPSYVSVLYVKVPENIQGGELSISHNKKSVGFVKPSKNTLVYFQGHLNHSVSQVKNDITRISLVCEQYYLNERELESIPDFIVESRKLKY